MSAKRYKIVITEYTSETKTVGNDWKRVSNDDNAKYGYTPEIQKTVDVERNIYLQNTDELDLGEVIKAINKL